MAVMSHGFQNYNELFLFFTNISPEILNIAKFNNVHMVSSDKFSSDYCFSKKKKISCWMAIRKWTLITVSGRFVE
jgi:hypothetical protein